MSREKRRSDNVSRSPSLKPEEEDTEVPLKKPRKSAASQDKSSTFPQAEWPAYFKEV